MVLEESTGGFGRVKKVNRRGSGGEAPGENFWRFSCILRGDRSLETAQRAEIKTPNLS